MKLKHTLGLTILSSTLLLGGCTDPISALLIKAGENSMYNIDSVTLYDKLTIDTKPDNATNVRVSNNKFVELDNIERIKHDTQSFSLDIATIDDFDSELIKSKVEKEFTKIGYTLDDNAEPIVINILELDELNKQIQKSQGSLAGSASIFASLGATVVQAVSAEIVGRLINERKQENIGIARKIA